ncbi:RNA-binding protein 15-like isoform X2 [Festucalex cinctus]
MKEKDRSPARKRARVPDDGKERRGSLASRRTGELLSVGSNNGNSYVPCGASSRRSLPGDKKDTYSDIRAGNGYDYGAPPGPHGGAVFASRNDPRSPESEYKTLKISDLGSQINDEDIEDGLFHEFKKFGNVSVKMSRENDERVAFVNFRKPEDARAAKHTCGRLVLFDRPLKVDVVYMNRRRSRSPLSKDNFPPGHRHVHPQTQLSPTGVCYRDFRLQQMALGPLPPPPLPHLTDVERDAYYSLYEARNQAAFLPEFHNDNLPDDDQRANRTLFLGNLDIGLTESDLRRAFDRFGTITEVDIKRAARGQNSTFGFVKFENLDMAHRAKVAMSGKVLRHNQVKIGYGKPTPTSRLWVGGLGSWISLAALAKEFDRFGTIRTIDYRKGEAWAYVQYESLDAAQAACTHMRGFPLGGPDRRLRVDFADTEHHYKQQHYTQPPLPLPHFDLAPPPFDHRFADSMRARSPLLPPPRFRERDLSLPADWSGLGVHDRMRGSAFPTVSHLERHSREQWPMEREWELQRGDASRRRRHLEHGFRPDRSPDNNVALPRVGSPADGGGDSNGEHAPRPGRVSPTKARPNSQDRRRRTLSPTAAAEGERKRKPGDKPKSPAGKERPSAQKLSQVWQGVLLLKNSSFPTALHLLDGDAAVVSRLLQDGAKGGQTSQLKISQRLRMDRPKLDEVSRRIKAAGPSGYSVLLATPGKSEDGATTDGKDSTERPLKNLVSYLKQKEAAGIVSLPVGGGARDKEHSGVLHAFPP